jgi:glycine/D-amino acid oxidase-like deaminating enzyme
MVRADAIIIGGGFYGCTLSLFLAKRGLKVLLIEKEKDLLLKASYNNQARIHNGYHYPRHYITGLRSHLNYKKFIKDYESAVYDKFKQYYAIAATFSKTTAIQFVKFSEHIGSSIKQAPMSVKKYFNNCLIDDVFEVEECVFNAGALRAQLHEQLETNNVRVITDRKISKIGQYKDKVTCHDTSGRTYLAHDVFNCTYSLINDILSNSKLDQLPLKHEYIEMPVIKVPYEFSKIAVTVMDGPFFGFLPFPDLGAHTLWHVRYAIHSNWSGLGDLPQNKIKSNYNYMIKDAQRYIPLLSESSYSHSINETKTVLIEKEENDGRPILFKKDYGITGFHVIMGGKIDNIYDIFEEIERQFKLG